MKKGDVSRNADARVALRASAPILRKAIMAVFVVQCDAVD